MSRTPALTTPAAAPAIAGVNLAKFAFLADLYVRKGGEMAEVFLRAMWTAEDEVAVPFFDRLQGDLELFYELEAKNLLDGAKEARDAAARAWRAALETRLVNPDLKPNYFLEAVCLERKRDEAQNRLDRFRAKIAEFDEAESRPPAEAPAAA